MRRLPWLGKHSHPGNVVPHRGRTDGDRWTGFADRLDRLRIVGADRAERRGELRAGMTILECTTGNAGIACAAVAAIKGYPCAVIMPEVFLKALTIARNLGGGKPERFTSVDLDMAAFGRRAVQRVAAEPAHPGHRRRHRGHRRPSPARATIWVSP